jgi:hypothetical protein
MNDLNALINSHPRFVVSIVPQRYDANLVDARRYEEVIATSQVRARGWYFPHINQSSIEVGPGEKYWANEINAVSSVKHVEKWRLYRSGQFVFRMKLWESGDDEVQSNMRRNQNVWSITKEEFAAIPGFVSFIGLIYSVSEAYVFASRLAQVIPYATRIEIRVGLRGARGWALGSTDFGIELSDIYIARSDKQDFANTLALDTLIASPFAHAVEASQSLFRQFSWANASADMIANWQRQIFKSA